MENNFNQVLEKVTGMVYDQFDLMLNSTHGNMPSQAMIDDSLKRVIAKLTKEELEVVCYTVLAGITDAQELFDLMILNTGIKKAGSETCIIQK